ncbi:hypothetical protein GCM10028810_30510 [Spirosoma litoris]
MASTICTGNQFLFVADYPQGASSGTLHIFDFPYTGAGNSPTYATNGCAPGIDTDASEGVAVDVAHKRIYVTTLGASQIAVYTSGGLQGSINLPSDYALSVAVDPSGNNLYVAAQHGLYRYDVSLGIPSNYVSFASNSTLGLSTDYLWGVSVSPTNGQLYVTTGWNPTDFLNGGATNSTTRILSVNPITLGVNSTLVNVGKFPALFAGITVASDGSLWVVNNNTVEHRDATTGNIIGSSIGTNAPAANAGAPDNPLWAITIGPDNKVYVGSGATTACVYQVDPGSSTASVYVPYDNSQTTLQRAKALAFLCSDITCPTPPVCAINLKPTVSGCYSVSGMSKATVSVEVSWSNAPSGNITVTLGGQTRTITPGVIQVNYGYNIGSHSQTIVSPQVVAFEIDLPDAGGAITASFDNSTACSDTKTYTAPAACPPTTCNATANQTGGTVFNDYNADGVLNTGETTGLADVTVKAIDCNGQVYTTTTDTYGKYVLDIPAANYPVRVEFSTLPTYASNGTLHGTDGGTTTQFVAAPSCGIDLGVLDPNDYCQSNPKIIVPCYVYGDPLNGSTSGTRDAVVGFNYSTSGLNDHSVMTAVADAATVGTTWGTAYNKFTRKLFLSATVKRHAGLGPLGLGGIYISDLSDPDSPVTSSWLDVTTLGINVGSIPTNAARGLVGDPTKPSADPSGYAAAGKLGIGGMDLSSDGNKLYFTNLFDNKLYELDITAYNTNGTLPTSANVKSYDMANGLSCPSGNLHAWAVKVHKGKVYVGLVCDAAVSQNKSDLRAYVQELDGTTVSTAFDFPLTYPKGFLDGAAPSRTGWFPWTDDWAIKIGFDRILIYPQPIFSSIEFDVDGSMVLAFGDRTGIQTGYFNMAPDNTNPNPSFEELYSGIVGGDILRAYSNGTSYILENNAKAGPTTGFGVNNGQGPGFGEFYNDNFINGGGGGLTHAENSVGGLALLPGSGEVVSVSMDPLDVPDGTSNAGPYFQAGGVRHMNNFNGQVNSAYVVYSSASGAGIFGKATGLGDAVLNCSTPTYLEIGNRVWIDTNKDGIQDACEKVLSGVNVSLYKGTTLIAITQTDENGEYYFSSKSKLSTGTWSGASADTTLLPNTAYQLLFGTSGQFASGVLSTLLGSFSITVANATGGLANDQNDSDIQLTTIAGTTAPGISVTTGTLGSVNHTFDAGFICVPTTVASVSVTPATCNVANNTANANGQISLTGINNADKAFLITSGPIPSYTATGSQTISASAVSFTGLANPATAGGQSYTIVIYNGPCCYTTVTALLPYTDCNCITPTNVSATATPANATTGSTISLNATATGTTSGTTTYTWSGPGITTPIATTVASLTVPGVATTGVSTYMVIVSNGSSCTATATASVTIAEPASIVVTSATVCYGSSATLVASGCTGIVTWSNSTTGTTLITPALTQATNYTATCTVAGSTTTAVGTVTVLAQPVLSLSASSTLVTVGTPVSLSAIGCVGTIAWSTGDSGSSVTVTPANPTNVYSATCTTGPTCTTAAFVTVTTQTPACQLALQVTPGSCTSATNQYTLTGTVSLTNAGVGSLTITDGSVSTVLTITANQSTAVFSLTGISSDGLVHTVTANLSNCGQRSTTYTAPQSCTVATCQPPVHVCKGSNYAIGLSTTAGLGTYQWYRDGVAITGATESSYTATQAGSYSVVVNGNVVGQCPDGSCCPVVIVEDSIALYQANAQSPTCSSATLSSANADGRILVSAWRLSVNDTASYYYQVSLGNSFDAAHIVAGGAAQPVPVDGVLVANLPNPTTTSGQAYTVRITNGLGCSKDVVVNLSQTVCTCPPAKCVPFVVKRVR